MKTLKSNLTIIVVSFKSRKKIIEIVSKIKNKINIMIVDNSNDKLIKKKLYKYKNISFVFPKNNNGFGCALNYAIKRTKTKYILYLDLDTKINYTQIKKIYKKTLQVKNFGVITAKIKNQNYNDLILGYDPINKMKYVKFNTGCVMMFNRKTFLKLGGFDENFFLYYEESDFYRRCIKLKKKIYLFEDIIIQHEGKGSIDRAYKEKYDILRNWHYCWSKFNYYNKHHSYLTACSKTFPNFVKAIKGMIAGIIKFNFYKFKLHFAEISGLIAAYLRFRSYYRLY
tara:strand:+ start:56 stop:904 length:849 start_codon:yes stop_codon:yes gene_type:complete